MVNAICCLGCVSLQPLNTNTLEKEEVPSECVCVFVCVCVCVCVCACVCVCVCAHVPTDLAGH